jgi:2-aminoadipate transaminase
MFFWVELPQGVDSEALLVKAVARGVAFVPGAPFFAGAAHANTLRLSFVTVGVELIERGIAALAAALGDLREDAVRAGGVKGAKQRAELAR